MIMIRKENFGILDFDERLVKVIKITEPLPYFSAPLKIFLEITNYCNLNKCSFCVNKSGSGRHCQLSLEQIDRIMQEAYKMKVLEVALTGGEPLLHPDFPEILETINKYGFPIYINTNACVDDSVLEALMKTEANIRKVTVSIDGPANIHNCIRGEGTFEITKNNIKKLINAYKEKETEVKLLFTACNRNKDEESINATFNIARELGCQMRITPMMSPRGCDKNVKDDVMEKSKSRDYFSYLIKKYEKNNPMFTGKLKPLSQFVHFDELVKNPCEFLINKKHFFYTKCGLRAVHLGINCKGEAFATGRQTEFYPEYKVGDINKDSLQEIWQNSILEYAKFHATCKNKCDKCAASYIFDNIENYLKEFLK